MFTRQSGTSVCAVLRNGRRGISGSAINLAEASNESASTSNVRAALLLSRNPIITRDVPEFEQKYFDYQAELKKRLMWTFPYYFYFKRGTMSERAFMTSQHKIVTKQPKTWYPKGIPDIRFNRERSRKQEVVIPKVRNVLTGEVDASLMTNPRTTPADEAKDTKSLERLLARTLYLVVKDSTYSNSWKFPSAALENGDSLHEAAERGLRELGGQNIKTWTVSSKPAAVMKFDKENKPLGSYDVDTDKVVLSEYLIKSHIIAGSFQKKDQRITDYAWLCKEELADVMSKEYYSDLECLLSDV